MNVFEFRDGLIGDYGEYVRSFIRIRDERIRDAVKSSLDAGTLWPEPLLQLNPTFECGGPLADLVRAGQLHPLCADVFRYDKSKDDPHGKPLLLHRHQREALEIAAQGHDYVVTTGTGSGKSLTYIIPIVDHILKNGSGNGIKAVIVYPMNALANSQAEELHKFLGFGFDRPPVTVRRYTGQESSAEKDEIIHNPPDILLTNYVMLELLLTRPFEQKLVAAASNLEYLVFDELHTYRGRQGADVAMLIRRVRERMGAPDLTCIGTSATMASEGTLLDRQGKVAEVASRIFGVTVRPEHVVGETLVRETPEADFEVPATAARLKNDTENVGQLSSASYDELKASAFASWLETRFGVEREEGTGRLIRATPSQIGGPDGAAAELARLTETDPVKAEAAIRGMLLAANRTTDPASGRPLFAFRLHQFISKGDAIYGTLEDGTARYLTLAAQQFAPGRKDEAALFPFAFCRECGHEYYTVWRNRDEGQLTARRLSETRGEEGWEAGYLYASADNPWPDADSMDEYERLPGDWLEDYKGETRLRNHRKKDRPETIQVSPAGVTGTAGKTFQYVSAPFRFCLHCRVTYPGRRGEFSKLNVFSSEGRATSTTILSLAAVRKLKESDLDAEARKLLSFSDNRQDAALQAGHFNDFVHIGLLRGALYAAAVKAGDDGLTHDEVARKVVSNMNLDFREYAEDPTVELIGKRRTERAFRDVIAYRIFQDLKRGWRLTAPNLEQVGLIRIHYPDLEEVCEIENYWQEAHPALKEAAPETREEIAGTLLDWMRRSLAIDAEPLSEAFQDSMRYGSQQRLAGEWALNERERLEQGTVVLARSRAKSDTQQWVHLSGRGGYGRYLRRDGVLPHLRERPSTEETEEIIRSLLKVLKGVGMLTEAVPARNENDQPGYQVKADIISWHAGDGTPVNDPLRVVHAPEGEREANSFFRHYYSEVAAGLQGFRAAEHTAQVMAAEREEREKQFREGSLPVLYCSPTMELGVDISSLNVVNMRNVPPTPANYAQRSGRAGRSGQPALVFTYCTTNNSHDQFYFKRPGQMVAGVVAAPRLDLANEELIRAHVNAIWLSETGVDLGDTLGSVLNLENETLPLHESINARISSTVATEGARKRAANVLASLEDELKDAAWYTPDWLEHALLTVRRRFDRTADRWRDLYRAANTQMDRRHREIKDPSLSADRHRQAERLYREARMQRALLIDGRHAKGSDFFSYRYFASEGFLPGYSFPRLPLSAFIPGRRRAGFSTDEYVSRPRFLAVQEFGPGAIIYHDGGKYRVNRVILPPDPDGKDGVAVQAGKRCDECGYWHQVTGDSDFDNCQRCDSLLPPAMTSLLRMQNVTTKRLERISSDEEERQRLGYDVITAYRFAGSGAGEDVQTATINPDGPDASTLEFGQAATIWRVNLGWRHRENKEDTGFALDVERGFWASDKALQKQDAHLDDDADPLSNSIRKVIPFVEDRRNCLVWRPARPLGLAQMASLQAALKVAVQVEYQLEDSELAAEPLPSPHERNALLFYEAAEGGAGVLRDLVQNPEAVRRVARKALEITHFDPDDGSDLGQAPGADERCEAACYNCLMSYGNQRDHEHLDRFLVRDLLLDLTRAAVSSSPAARSRPQHLEWLRQRADSSLEVKFIDMLEQKGLRLPDQAQNIVELPGEQGKTKPDFFYDEYQVAIYVDGPPHDHADVKARDRELDRLLLDAGINVLRFHYQDDWEEIFEENQGLFGGDQ